MRRHWLDNKPVRLVIWACFWTVTILATIWWIRQCHIIGTTPGLEFN